MMQTVDLALKQFEKNLFIQKYQSLGVKERLFSDTAGAMGHLQKQVTRCAYPNLVGRKIITTATTMEPVERFPLDSKAVAYSYVEGAACRFSGRKTQFATVKTDMLSESSEQWTREFVEDASPNVFLGIFENVGKALGENETKKVIDLYGSIQGSDLAGGEVLDNSGQAMDWTAVMALHNAVRRENWRPNVLLLNENQLSQLLLDNRFIEYDYLASSGVDLESSGLIRKIVGMNVEASSLVPNGIAYAIDTRVSGVMLIRRDVTVEDWSDPMANRYGVKASTRFGLGILRSNAVAKMINIRTVV
jgi:hypothetical protein